MKRWLVEFNNDSGIAQSKIVEAVAYAYLDGGPLDFFDEKGNIVEHFQRWSAFEPSSSFDPDRNANPDELKAI